MLNICNCVRIVHIFVFREPAVTCMMQGDLKDAGEVRVLKLTTDPNELCLVLNDDYTNHVRKHIVEMDISKLIVGVYCVI